jgi:hypothetical protein
MNKKKRDFIKFLDPPVPPLLLVVLILAFIPQLAHA